MIVKVNPADVVAVRWQGISARLQLGRCGHVFGLLVRFA
jgi:hypothetical protein